MIRLAPRRAAGVALALTLAASLAACSPGDGLPPLAPAPSVTAGSVTGTVPVPATSPAPDVTLVPLEPGAAPTQRFQVGQRELQLARDDRPLRTVVWFPAVSPTVGSPLQPAEGVFPLVLFSHGVRGTPESYQRLITAIVSAGFVVAAPAYPYTHGGAVKIEPMDVLNQPADASVVITAVLNLSSTAGDPLEGRLDPNRVAAAGHSGGGFTTTGLLSHARDARVRSAVVIAGGMLTPAFAEPAASVLFIHGDADDVVRYSLGRGAYDLAPWPKAFLTVVDGDHSGYLYQPGRATTAVADTMVEFLRATLYADAEALARIPSTAAVTGVTTFESLL